MWSVIVVTLCVCSATAQFSPFGFSHFPGQQGFDGYGGYGAPEFSQFQGVSTTGRDFNVNSLSGYGVPPSVNYGAQGFPGQGFDQYGAQGYPGHGGFPQDVGQNHLPQGGPTPGAVPQHESNIQHGAPNFSQGGGGGGRGGGGQGQAPVIGQPGQSVLNPGHQQNVPLPNHIGGNQGGAEVQGQTHASQQLAPQHEHQHQVPHHQNHHNHQQQGHHPQGSHHGEAQIGSGHVPHLSHQGGHPGVPAGNQFEVNYNGVSQYQEQYQGLQLGLQVPQQYQQQTQQHTGEKSASSPSASSAPLESGTFKGIPLEAFAQQNYGQQLQHNPGEQTLPRSSGEAHSQRADGQTEESTKKEVQKSSS